MKLFTVHISPDTIAKLASRLQIKMNDTPSKRRRILGYSLPRPLSDHEPNLPFNLSTNSSPVPSRSLGERLRTIFPPGFESSSSSAGAHHYIFTPRCLHDMLLDNYSGNRHVENTVVKNAWYGKQKRSARHEFIILQVEDLSIPGLENFIALDRNQTDRPSSPGGVPNITTISSSANASDTFRISYDGNLSQFLRECQLSSNQWVEQIEFRTDEPLLLLDLVALVQQVSENHPKYNPVDTNCYWFTGLIWECMRRIRPTARHDVHVAGRRGKIGVLRCVPNPVQIWNVLQDLQKQPRLSDQHFTTPEVESNAVMAEARTDVPVTGGT